MDGAELLVDLHAGLDRLGPGGEAETRRAIELAGLEPGSSPTVADLGCGAGASAVVLAEALGARVTAVDAAPAFVERVGARAAAAGVGDLVTPTVGRMEALPFADETFDVVWSEGAIYTIGFGAGVRAWRRLLRPGGVLAVTELSWTTSGVAGGRPADVESHWAAEYPGIGTAASNARVLEEAGYRLEGFFWLPAACWHAYYEPLRARFEPFLERHGRGEAARAIVAATASEARLYQERGDWYGYGFYIARRVR